MKLHDNSDPGLKLFTSHGEGYVTVNRERFENNLLVLPDRIEPAWTGHDFARLCIDDFARLAACGAEIVLLGTGLRLRFPHPALQQPLMAAGIGLEVMDTAAACRTYNILASEGRKVAAALLIETPIETP
ncbi:MAG: Mth938-like domain-containing protein [Azovibrio sp.]|uniref:Mth938-like domain-containing protein n=1 Tax=Azovibrio sp. TaxID=1872673 RepID=UPI003C740A45